MSNSFLTIEELKSIGFASFGENTLISRNVVFYNPQNISIGNNVRIDDFCILSASGKIMIANFVHIAVFSTLIGKGDIILHDYTSISGRVSIYSSTDDYTGMFMTNPMVPEKCRGVYSGNVIFEKHVIIGAGSVVLPGVTLKEGAAVGALSLVDKDLESFSIYRGVPAIKIANRQKRLLKLEGFAENKDIITSNS